MVTLAIVTHYALTLLVTVGVAEAAEMGVQARALDVLLVLRVAPQDVRAGATVDANRVAAAVVLIPARGNAIMSVAVAQILVAVYVSETATTYAYMDAQVIVFLGVVTDVRQIAHPHARILALLDAPITV